MGLATRMYNAVRTRLDGAGGNAKAFSDQGVRTYLGGLFPRTPDLTDEAVQAAAREGRERTGMNRRSTFLSSSPPGSR